MTHAALLALEADHVFSYLFQSPRLREVRGAAALTDRLNRLVTRDIVEQSAGADSVIFADGGSCLAIVPAPDADMIANRVRRAYRLTAATATVSAAWVPLQPDQEVHGFGEAVGQVMARLALAKRSSAEPDALTDHPFVRLCDYCGRYPAEQRDAQEHRWRCGACQAKHEEQERDPATGPWMRLRWFAEAAGDDVRMLRRVRPREVEEIGAGADARGMTGLVFCDGNSVGQRLQTLPSRERVARFVESTNDLLEEVTFRAILETVPVELIGASPCLPCEPLLLGGDDVLLLAPATLAFPLALRLLQRFEQESPGRTGGEKLFLSAGVVLAPASTPLALQAIIARDLVRSAKRRFQETGATTSALDFWVVGERTSVAELPSRLRGTPNEIANGERRLLTQRPLTARRAEILLHDAGDLRAQHVAPDLLRQIGDAAARSRDDAVRTARLLMARCTLGQQAALTRALASQQPASELPWRREQGRGGPLLTTPVLDLLDVLPFVAGSHDADR